MRVGLEELHFPLGKQGYVWTNHPDYGKISALNKQEIRYE
jgi:hypothetical protein